MLPAPIRRWIEDQPSEQREIIYGVMFLIFWMGVGTAGYCVLEKWPVLDAFYMSFITLTTIGFSEVHTLSASGQIFTVAFAIIGIGIVALVAARNAQLLIAGAVIRERHRTRIIRRMQNHFVLCGYGRVGEDVSRALLDAGEKVVVIELNEDDFQTARSHDVPAICGDATQEAVLRSAGAHQAQGLITLLPEDILNVYVTLVGREINPDLFILARAYEASSRKRLIRAGASQVVVPEHIGASHIAQVILRPQVDQFISQVLKEANLGIIIEQVTVEPGSYLVDKTLHEARFRHHFEAIVVCILKAPDFDIKFPPGPHDRLEAGDLLLVLGSREMIQRLVNLGCVTGSTVEIGPV